MFFCSKKLINSCYSAYKFELAYLTNERLIELNKDLLKNGAMCNSIPNGVKVCCGGQVWNNQFGAI
jgi:hypothetical protein